jgi:serine/threonine-protein kinase RsbT
MAMDTDVRVPVRAEPDIVAARQEGRRLAQRIGFNGSDLALVATAISEVARNILQHAGRGEVAIAEVALDGRAGIEVVASDDGPGIADVERAMQDGYSTTSSLGLGLPGARRLMDELEVESAPGCGTTITLRKWLSR